MELKLTLTMDNAAFDGDRKYYETAAILRRAAERIKAGELEFKLRDVNGNTVGKIEVSE